MATPKNAVAPNLPVAVLGYDRVSEEQFRNVLRLYFNLQDNNIGQIIEAVNSAVALQWLGDLS